MGEGGGVRERRGEAGGSRERDERIDRMEEGRGRRYYVQYI